jgi:hypothetical protein
MKQALRSNDSGIIHRRQQLVEIDAAHHRLIFLVTRRGSHTLLISLVDASLDELEEVGALAVQSCADPLRFSRSLGVDLCG